MSNIIIDGNEALHEVPYDATAYVPAGVRVDKWERKPIQDHKLGFEVEVYVEGYRPNKDVWLHDKYDFDTLQAALDWLDTLQMSHPEKQAEMLNFEGYYKGTGWYMMSVEYFTLYEYTAEGTYQWQRKR